MTGSIPSDQASTMGSPADLLAQAAAQGLGLPAAGDQIGRWQIERQIGEGGFSLVFLASDLEDPSSKAAVKLLKPGLDTLQILQRFQREQTFLADLSHPGIATILETLVTQRGSPCIVMEYLPGGTILRWCNDARRGLDERIAMFLQVCEALEYAHTRGVIHRDIKPSNLLVSGIGDVSQVKVIDFGIARAIQTEAGVTMLTQQGRPLGTPSWMAPEQWEGDADVRTDVFAMGLLLCMLLFGVRPTLSGSRSTTTSLSAHAWREELGRFHPREAIQELEAGDRELALEMATERDATIEQIRRLSTSGPAWMIKRCLAVDPGDRYQSIRELSDDLSRWQRGLRISVGPPSLSDRFANWVDRHRKAVMIGVASLVLIAVLGVAAGVLAIVENNLRQQAQEQARVTMTLAQLMVGTIIDDGSGAGQEAEPIDHFQSTVNGVIDSMGEIDAVILATALVDLGEQFVKIGQDERARVVLTQARNALGDAASDAPGVDLRLRVLLGGVLGETDHPVEAFDLLKPALGTLSSMPQEAELEIQARLNMINATWVDYQRSQLGLSHDDHLAMIETALDRSARMLGPMHPKTLHLRGSQINYYSRGVDPIRAVELARPLLVDWEKTQGVKSREAMGMLITLAFLEHQVGNSQFMLDVYNQRRSEIIDVLGQRHPAVMNLFFNVAVLPGAMNPQGKAMALEEVWESKRIASGPMNPMTRWYGDSFLLALVESGDAERARVEIARRLSDLQTHFDRPGPFSADDFFSDPQIRDVLMTHPETADTLSVLLPLES